MEKRLGIVLESYDGIIMKGYHATSKVEVNVDESGRLQIIQKIIKTCFELDTEKNIYTVYSFSNDEIAQEIGRQLKKIGFSSLTLIFNGFEIPLE